MIKPLTSLRFIFALMVLLSHCEFLDPHFSKHLYTEGFVGVSFFFILSGFIITYAYKNKFENNKISRKDFWIARIARIYPLHVVTLFFVIILGIYPFSNLISWIAHFIPNLLLLQPFIPIDHFYYSFNSPSWSLGCEQLFYFLFPFLVLWLPTSKKIIMVLLPVIIVILIGMYFTPAEQTIVNTVWYVNPVTRFPDFLIGMLLFHLYEANKEKKMSIAVASVIEVVCIALFLAFYILSQHVSIVYRASAFYWIPIILIILVFARSEGILSKILSLRIFVLLGEISFGIYMFQWITLKMYSKIMVKWSIDLPFYVSFSAIFCATLLLSLLSYYYMEKPANRKIRSLSK